MYLITPFRIVEVKKTNFIRRLRCKHCSTVTGKHCSSMGLTRISGEDIYTVCEDCGKILIETHTNYN